MEKDDVVIEGPGKVYVTAAIHTPKRVVAHFEDVEDEDETEDEETVKRGRKIVS